MHNKDLIQFNTISTANKIKGEMFVNFGRVSSLKIQRFEMFVIISKFKKKKINQLTMIEFFVVVIIPKKMDSVWNLHIS